MKYRYYLILSLLLAGYGAVLSRLAYLQLWCHDDLARKAQQQSTRCLKSAPFRGPILDRCGRSLAMSVRVGSCFADPTLIDNVERTARDVGTLVGESASVLTTKIRKTRGAFVWMKRYLSAEQSRSIEKSGWTGVGLKWEYRRHYPNGNLASNLLGLVGSEGHGMSGLELLGDEWLLDRPTPQRFLRDGRGVGVEVLSTDKWEPQSWMMSTIDQTIQYIAERELDWGMKRSKASRGVVVVQDPRTGEILALASRPSLNLSPEHKIRPEELQVPGVHWVFEPGSTFKVVTAAAALEEQLVSPNETFDCENGEWKTSGLTIHDHEREQILTFAQVIERSSNIGTAKVGLRLGKEKFFDYVRLFGFGAPTASELPGEASGMLRPISRWSGVSLPMISFGQEIGVTPVQLACAYSAIANGGTLMEARILQKVSDPGGVLKSWVIPSPIRQMVSPKTCQTVTRFLEGVVERGTGKAAAMTGWKVAGKTGTAQKIDPRTRKYSAEKYVASFCGFVPSRNPRLTIVVILDEPKGISWGGYNAGPVFRNVASHVLTYLGISPDDNALWAGEKKKGGIPS
ncbi:MAG TPA: penicillin-binding protein 2 [Elusimicrobiota bacterium]|nr:penicillin-binding protein 2 [Elusimicrobiota bacterium]